MYQNRMQLFLYAPPSMMEVPSFTKRNVYIQECSQWKSIWLMDIIFIRRCTNEILATKLRLFTHNSIRSFCTLYNPINSSIHTVCMCVFFRCVLEFLHSLFSRIFMTFSVCIHINAVKVAQIGNAHPTHTNSRLYID